MPRSIKNRNGWLSWSIKVLELSDSFNSLEEESLVLIANMFIALSIQALGIRFIFAISCKVLIIVYRFAGSKRPKESKWVAIQKVFNRIQSCFKEIPKTIERPMFIEMVVLIKVPIFSQFYYIAYKAPIFNQKVNLTMIRRLLGWYIAHHYIALAECFFEILAHEKFWNSYLNQQFVITLKFE